MSPASDPALATLAVRVAAPRRAVFRFLADVENVSRWGAEFCERLELARGRWLALTLAGELFVELEADERSGVVDVRCGEEHELLGAISLRVLAGPVGDTIVSMVLCRAPRENEAAFGVRRARVEGGLRRLAGLWSQAGEQRVA